MNDLYDSSAASTPRPHLPNIVHRRCAPNQRPGRRVEQGRYTVFQQRREDPASMPRLCRARCRCRAHNRCRVCCWYHRRHGLCSPTPLRRHSTSSLRLLHPGASHERARLLVHVVERVLLHGADRVRPHADGEACEGDAGEGVPESEGLARAFEPGGHELEEGGSVGWGALCGLERACAGRTFLGR